MNKFIYIVRDDERNIDIIYDEETFKKEYKKYILTPPLYTNKDFWMKYTDVIRWELNTENSENINPEDMKVDWEGSMYEIVREDMDND